MLDATESQNLAWAGRETGTLGRYYWETEDQLKGYAWYGRPAARRRRQRARHRPRPDRDGARARRAGDHTPCRRGPVDRVEIELIVKRPGRNASDTIRMPTSAALLSRNGSDFSHDDPDFVTSRAARIDTGALETTLLNALLPALLRR